MKTLTDLPIGTLEEVGDILDRSFPTPEPSTEPLSSQAGIIESARIVGTRQVVMAFRNAVKYIVEKQENKDGR